MVKPRFVNCPRCGAQTAWTSENPHRPFCSERCKLIDMGDWAMGRYRVPVEDDNDIPQADGDAPNP